MVRVVLALVAVLLLPFFSLALTQDFCVADMSGEDTPSGYPCKPPSNVTADDFYYRGLATPGQISPLFGVAFVAASVQEFHGLNGLGLSAARVDFIVGGVVPIHTHPRASEFIFILEGNITVGFIAAASNTVYTKTLGKGDMYVFPQGLQHFQYNAGPKTAAELAVFSNQNLGVQVFDNALFGNDMSATTVQKVTFVSPPEVRRLKKLFGGSG